MYLIYVRKSRLDKEKTLEIDKQIELLTDYAYKNNMEFIIFAEKGSSEDYNREKFQEMISYIENNSEEVKGILSSDLDRLSRNRTDLGIFVRDVLLKNEVLEVHTLDVEYDLLNEDDLFLIGMKSQMDEYLISITKKKLLRGRIQAIKKGVWFGARLFGYSKDENKKLVPNEESETVKYIFDQYVYHNKPMENIADELNLLGKRTIKDEPFTGKSISIILENRTYLGEINYSFSKGETIFVPEAHKPIIDLETFNKVQEIRQQKRHTGSGQKKNVYALSQLIKCPKCGAKLSFEYKYYKKKARREMDKQNRTLCTTACKVVTPLKIRKSPDFVKCTNKSIKFERLYNEVIHHLKQKIELLQDEIDSLVEGSIDSTKQAKVKIDIFQERISQLDNQRKRVQDGFKAGIYTLEESQKEIETIEKQKKQLEDKIKEAEATNNTTEIDRKKILLNNIQSFLSSDLDNHSEANQLLRDFIEVIYYYKEEADSRNGTKPFEILIIYK